VESTPAGDSWRFLHRIFGRMPESLRSHLGSHRRERECGVKTKTIVGHIDNSAYPEVAPAINVTLTLPANASGPVPVMVVVSSAPTGAPRRPATTGAANAPAVRAVRGEYRSCRRESGPRSRRPSPMRQVLDRGWATPRSTPRACRPTMAAV